MYHIIHIPIVHDRTKHSKGNGGRKGSSIGHRPKSLIGESSILYGDGCLKWGIKRCEDCHRPDCDFDFAREYELRKALEVKG